MTSSRRIRTRVSSCILAVLLLLPPLVSVDAAAQSHIMSLEQLTTTSSAVVLGRVEKPRSFWNEDRTQILTEVRIRVDESVKGSTSEETVITIPGGQVGNMLHEVSDMPVFVDGEQVLVFLWEHSSGKQLVTAGALGKLEVIEREGGDTSMIRGAAPLLKDTSTLGKTSDQDPSVTSSGDIPLENVIAQIRSYAQE